MAFSYWFLCYGPELVAQTNGFAVNDTLRSMLPEGAKILGLGDPTHQERTITEYRIDLIKKLVREEGYSVIAVEGNFLEMFEAHRDFLISGEYSFYERAMYAQLNATEMEPLYDFVADENRRGHRVSLIGFDVAFSGTTFPERVSARLQNDTLLSTEDREEFVKLLKKASNSSITALFRNGERIKAGIRVYAQKIITTLEPEDEADAFFLQALRNLVWYFDSEDPDARDLAMFQNVEFMHRYYEGEKIILFGSSTHLLKSPKSIHGNDTFWQSRKTLGEELDVSYGDAYHFIAYTALSGSQYQPFGKPNPLPGIEPGSVEDHVNQNRTGLATFMGPQDFRPGGPVKCRMLGHRFVAMELWKVTDGLVLIPDVEPFEIKKVDYKK